MRAVPQRRVRFLKRHDFHRHVVEPVVSSLKGQPLRGESLHRQFEPLGVNLLPLLGVLPVISHLEGHRAAAEADLQPPAAQVVEHADFFHHPQRMVQRQRIVPNRSRVVRCAMADRNTLGEGAMPSGVK